MSLFLLSRWMVKRPWLLNCWKCKNLRVWSCFLTCTNTLIWHDIPLFLDQVLLVSQPHSQVSLTLSPRAREESCHAPWHPSLFCQAQVQMFFSSLTRFTAWSRKYFLFRPESCTSWIFPGRIHICEAKIEWKHEKGMNVIQLPWRYCHSVELEFRNSNLTI